MTRVKLKTSVNIFISISLLVLISFIPFPKICSAKGIIIKFESRQNKKIAYQIFYTEDKEKEFNEKQSTIAIAKKSDTFRTISFKLANTKKIEKLRLDFGTTPGVIKIKNIEFTGQSNIKVPIEQFKNCFKYQIEDFSIKDGVLTINSQLKDPFIIIDPNNLKSKSLVVTETSDPFAYSFFIFIFIFLFLSGFCFFNFKYKGKKINIGSKVDMILIFSVFVILCIPMSKIDSKQINLKENRTLAPRPELFKPNGLNLKYMKDFGKYFNDRFRTRKALIDLQSSIKRIINNNRKENNKAFLGLDDWIFYKGSDSIANYQNKIPFSENDLIEIKRNLEKKIKWLGDLGIKFYVFIPPDKNRIYGEYYPKYIYKVGGQSRLKEMVDFIAEKINFRIITPHDQMLSQKQDDLLFYKEDTHWTNHGAFIGYQVLMDEIVKDFPGIKTLKKSDFDISKDESNHRDLSDMLLINKKHYKKMSYKKFNFRKPNFQYLSVEKNEHSHTKNLKANLKVIAFIDSFGGTLAPGLSQTFGEVICISDYNINKYQEKIKKEKPDIIIHESVERLIHSFKISLPVLGEN